MGSTFWAELYFRSLKSNKVLSLFTRYLVQYGRVCIPHVGSFELVCEPPRHDVADKSFSAPVYSTRYSSQDQVTEHQYRYFSFSENPGREALHSFGEELRNSIRQSPFQWSGFGVLKLQSSAIHFEPQPLILSSLQPVPALKVTREDARHHVLVGDQEIRSGIDAEATEKVPAPRQYEMLIGWIILAIAITAIIIYLFLNNFQVSASGLQWKANA